MDGHLAGAGQPEPADRTPPTGRLATIHQVRRCEVVRFPTRTPQARAYGAGVGLISVMYCEALSGSILADAPSFSLRLRIAVLCL